MIKKIQQFSLRDLFSVGLPVLLAVVAAFYLAAQFIKPAPPERLVISTGGDAGAYRIFAARYRDVLARYAIDLEIQPSEGALDNLARLRDGSQSVDIGFFQGGSALPSETDELVSLGDLYYEPLWIFYRAALEAEQGQRGQHVPLDRLSDLRGRRIAIGSDGSGTQVLARALLDANAMTAKNTRLIETGGLAQVEQLRRGILDAIMVVGPTESAVVWTLLHTPGVRLMSLAHAEAYSRRLPYLSHLTLPRGTINLDKEIPPRTIDLVATRATLLARADTHPALLDLMMQAVSEVHAVAGTFQRPAEFPRAGNTDFPLAPEAKRFYASGKPWLQRFLPFWAATLVDRMLVMLLPFVAVLVPLFKLAPSLYHWRIKSRIFRHYGELKFLEAEFAARDTVAATELQPWLTRLDAIEHNVNQLRAPLAFTDMFYTLRSHIALVRTLMQRELR